MTHMDELRDAQEAAGDFTRKTRGDGWLVLFSLARTGRIIRFERCVGHPSPIPERTARRRANAISGRLVDAYARRQVEHVQARRRHGAAVPRSWQLCGAEELRAYSSPTAPTSPPARSAPRPRARRPRAQSARSSAKSGDSGSDDAGDPPRPRPALGLAPPARAFLTFGCLTAAERGEEAGR